LEDVILLLGEEDDPDQLALYCHEVSPHHTHRNSVFLSKGLKFSHSLLIIDLDYSRSFVNKGAPVNIKGGIGHSFE
jgi:hypothetical protein